LIQTLTGMPHVYVACYRMLLAIGINASFLNVCV